MNSDVRPHHNQADQSRFFARVVAPALVELPVLPLYRGDAGTTDAGQEIYFENPIRYTSNEVAIEARRSFALALAAIFERQLSRYWLGNGGVGEPAFARMLDAAIVDTGVEASDLKPTLHELHTLANAVRHGDGPALNALRGVAPSLWPDSPDVHVAKWLVEKITVTDAHFLRYAEALATFWGRADRLPGAIAEVRYGDLETAIRLAQGTASG